MIENSRLTIYEYLNQNGDPDAYVCEGHVDSMTFRDAVQQEFSVKPLVVQHRWRRTKRIVKRDIEKKQARGYTTNVPCFSDEPDSFAVTVGIL